MSDCCSCCRPCNGIRLWLREQRLCQEILAVAAAVIFPLKKGLSAVEVMIQNGTGGWQRGKAVSRYDRKMEVLKASIFPCLTASVASYHCADQGSSCNLRSPQILPTCSLCYTNWGKKTQNTKPLIMWNFVLKFSKRKNVPKSRQDWISLCKGSLLHKVCSTGAHLLAACGDCGVREYLPWQPKECQHAEKAVRKKKKKIW